MDIEKFFEAKVLDNLSKTSMSLTIAPYSVKIVLKN